MKITTIGDAAKCLAKMRAGKSCTSAEAKATAMILGTALDSSKRGSRLLRQQLIDSKQLVQSLLSRIGL
jgi:hypothetical protein